MSSVPVSTQSACSGSGATAIGARHPPLELSPLPTDPPPVVLPPLVPSPLPPGTPQPAIPVWPSADMSQYLLSPNGKLPEGARVMWRGSRETESSKPADSPSSRRLVYRGRRLGRANARHPGSLAARSRSGALSAVLERLAAQLSTEAQRVIPIILCHLKSP